MPHCRMSYQDYTKISNIIHYFQLVALLGAVLLVGANAFVLSPILSDVARGLATEPGRVAWAISAFGAATAVSALTLAGLIDRFPVARVLAGAALVLAIAQLLSAASRDWLWLCLSQGLAGMAVGVLLPGTYATAAATAPEGRVAARLGLVLTGWALSLVLAVPFAAWVAERLGWRLVYCLLAALSVLVGTALLRTLPTVESAGPTRTSPLRALSLPGVAPVLVVMFAYMTAFYGSFAFFGEGMRHAFDLSASGAGIFILAYGAGFGLAGLGQGVAAPAVTRSYVLVILFAIAASYAGWRFALDSPRFAFAAAMAWGVFNQLGLTALVVSLNQRAADARGAVMGLNSAVTYSAVFAGPMIMGPFYSSGGFFAVSSLASVIIILATAISYRAI